MLLSSLLLFSFSVNAGKHDGSIRWKHFFRVIGPLGGEFTGHLWIPLTKAGDAELWCFLLSAPWINSWINNRDAGHLRRHRTHYDVIVMAILFSFMITLFPSSTIMEQLLLIDTSLKKQLIPPFPKGFNCSVQFLFWSQEHFKAEAIYFYLLWSEASTLITDRRCFIVHWN